MYRLESLEATQKNLATSAHCGVTGTTADSTRFQLTLDARNSSALRKASMKAGWGLNRDARCVAVLVFGLLGFYVFLYYLLFTHSENEGAGVNKLCKRE